jgi:hypothetical protein
MPVGSRVQVYIDRRNPLKSELVDAGVSKSEFDGLEVLFASLTPLLVFLVLLFVGNKLYRGHKFGQSRY